MVAWQKVALERIHTGKTITIDVSETELLFHCDDGDRTVRRTNNRPVTRIKGPPPPQDLRPKGDPDDMNPYETGRMADISEDNLEQVATPTDVANIIEQMTADLQAHPSEWENHTLERFLEALACYLPSQQQVYINNGEPYPVTPTWKLFAEALVAATGYE